jgi:putative acetyltransferase
MKELITVHTAQEYEAAARLFAEYAAAIEIDLGFQHFDDELNKLQQMYTMPTGGIFLYRHGDTYVACVAVRSISSEVAELKRMFVRPQYQGQGIGRLLLEKSLELARHCGYKKIQLDTLNHMRPAINLYTAYGFYEIPAYYHNPISTALYFEKLL